jgi:hypothetical protein
VDQAMDLSSDYIMLTVVPKIIQYYPSTYLATLMLNMKSPSFPNYTVIHIYDVTVLLKADLLNRYLKNIPYFFSFRDRHCVL